MMPSRSLQTIDIRLTDFLKISLMLDSLHSVGTVLASEDALKMVAKCIDILFLASFTIASNKPRSWCLRWSFLFIYSYLIDSDNFLQEKLKESNHSTISHSFMGEMQDSVDILQKITFPWNPVIISVIVIYPTRPAALTRVFTSSVVCNILRKICRRIKRMTKPKHSVVQDSPEIKYSICHCIRIQYIQGEFVAKIMVINSY